MGLEYEQFGRQLRADLQRIYAGGLPEDVSASALPALAELADTFSATPYDRSADYYTEAIEAVLHRALDLPESGRRAEGIKDLIGLGIYPPLTQGARLDNAAPYIDHQGGRPYSNGGSLRQSRPGGRPVTDALLDDLLQRLLALVDDDFEYTGKYASEPPLERSQFVDTPLALFTHRRNPPIGQAAIEWAHLSLLLLDELCTIARLGLDEARASKEVPNLLRLAKQAVDNQLQAKDALWTLLRWAVAHANGNRTEKMSMGAFLGIWSSLGDSTYTSRRRTVARYFGSDLDRTPEPVMQVLQSIRDQLLLLAVELDYRAAPTFERKIETMFIRLRLGDEHS